MNTNKKIIEALMFVQGERGLSPKQLKSVLEDITTKEAREALKSFKDEINISDRALIVLETNDIFKFVTRKDFDEVITKLVAVEKKQKLSAAAIETAGIIAYKQPITKSQVNEVRGVSSEAETSQPVADSSSNDPSAHFQSIETSPQPTTPSAGTPSSRSGDGRHDRSRRRPSSRRSAPTSTTAEMIKVILGGLLAFPTAYLVVFWVFHRDPLEIGPATGKVVPFVVPEKLRKSDDGERNVPSSQFDDQEGLLKLNSLDDLPSADLPSGN